MSATTEVDELNRLARSLRDLVVAGDHLRRAMAAHDGIGLSEFMALSQLYFGGDAGPSELARNLGLTPGSMTLLLDRLAEVGYVKRVPHPVDRRRQIISITPSGRSLHRASFGRFADAVKQVARGQDSTHLRELSALVEAVVSAVQQRTETL